MDCPGLPGIVLDYQGLSRITRDCPGLLGIVLNTLTLVLGLTYSHYLEIQRTQKFRQLWQSWTQVCYVCIAVVCMHVRIYILFRVCMYVCGGGGGRGGRCLMCVCDCSID